MKSPKENTFQDGNQVDSSDKFSTPQSTITSQRYLHPPKHKRSKDTTLSSSSTSNGSSVPFPLPFCTKSDKTILNGRGFRLKPRPKKTRGGEQVLIVFNSDAAIQDGTKIALHPTLDDEEGNTTQEELASVNQVTDLEQHQRPVPIRLENEDALKRISGFVTSSFKSWSPSFYTDFKKVNLNKEKNVR